MEKIDRNASPTIFGFQFQINVAIYFMFYYLKTIKQIRIEGTDEDIEVTLTNKSKYMVQAKSQTKDLYSNSNNSTYLKKAMLSLAVFEEGYAKSGRI